MNKIDFLKYTNFPLDSHTMDFLQGIIGTVAGMSAVCGDKVIVAGGEDKDGRVADGLVIVKGELLELKGDVRVDKVYIEERKEGVICLNEDYEDLYIRRCVKFGIGNGGENYNWSDFTRLDTLPVMMKKIADMQANKSNVGHHHGIVDITALSDKIVPQGLIAMWSGSPSNIPTGWALCNGQRVNGVLTPDLRGRFIVGYSGSGDYSSVGRTGGADSVSISESQMPRHRHLYTDDTHAIGKFNYIESGFPSVYDSAVQESSATSSGKGYAYYTTYSGNGNAHENRPSYYVLAFIIKI